jgi:hypothetical protein
MPAENIDIVLVKLNLIQERLLFLTALSFSYVSRDYDIED